MENSLIELLEKTNEYLNGISIGVAITWVALMVLIMVLIVKK